MNTPNAFSIRGDAAAMIDAWAARHLGHIEDVSAGQADRLATARLWVRQAMALPMSGPGAPLLALPSPKGR